MTADTVRPVRTYTTQAGAVLKARRMNPEHKAERGRLYAIDVDGRHVGVVRQIDRNRYTWEAAGHLVPPSGYVSPGITDRLLYDAASAFTQRHL